MNVEERNKRAGQCNSVNITAVTVAPNIVCYVHGKGSLAASSKKKKAIQ